MEQTDGLTLRNLRELCMGCLQTVHDVFMLSIEECPYGLL